MGWKSRKFQLALLTMALIFGAWLICGHPADLFGELCMGILAAAGIYKTSNFGEQWLASRTPPKA